MEFILPTTPVVRRLALMLMPFVGIASLLGGSVFWLRRVGWLQRAKYWISDPDLFALAPNQKDWAGSYYFIMRHHAAMHQIDGWLRVTKLAKEAVLVAFLVLAVTQIAKLRLTRSLVLTYGGIFLLGFVSALTTMFACSWFALIAGGRTFVAWCLGATAGPLVDAVLLRRLARVCAWTLVAEAVLVVIELNLGLYMYSIELYGKMLVRVVGTFNLPVSLGTFAVVTWATAFCWGELPRRYFVLLTCVLVFVLVFSASGAAWVAFVVAVATMGFAQVQARWRAWLLLSVLPIALLGWSLLPAVTGRWDIHDSLWGRIAPVQLYASEHASMREVLFGTGLGVGTNAQAAVSEDNTPPVFGGIPDRPVGDSMPAVLFWEIGLVGMALVYSLFVLALRADERSRAIGMALLVSSVAVNITELFPVNLILGLWLANAARQRNANDAS
jgi:hypothetical protein